MVDDQHSSSSDGSSVSNTTRSFDLGQEGDLLKLLNFIRRGPVQPDQKAILRDAVLDFSITKDAEGLGQLVSILETFSVTLIYNGENLSRGQSETEIVLDKPASDFVETTQFKTRLGGVRPKPIFLSSNQAFQAHESEVPQVPDLPEVKAPEVKKVIPVSFIPSSVATDITEQAKITTDPAQESVLDEDIVFVESKVKETPVEPVMVAKQPAIQMISDSESSNAPKLTTTQEPSIETTAKYPDPLARIKEIKQTVNQKVGNPVNLIDANNEVGREYMNSLLNAMKTVNAGTTAEVNLAMDRLEASFKIIEELIISGTTVLPAVEEKKSSFTASKSIINEKSIPKEDEKPLPQVDILAHANVIDNAKQKSDMAVEITPKKVDQSPTPTGLSETINPPVRELEPEALLESTNTAPELVEPKSIIDSVATKLVAQEEAIEKQTQAKVAEIEATQGPVSTDPLMSPEITDGLKQLLNEWRIFKGGGIFGTGPSGIDHPLFKTLSTLPMAAVITSRFEGSTPEIKQSISDYMNGWHYEQGVVHEMSETFEHYLRRIIATILSRKKLNPKA